MWLSSTLKYLTRCRWKLFHVKNPGNSRCKNTFGFNTTNPAPPDPDLKKFEESMLDLINKVKTRPVANQFQQDLRNKVEEIHNCPDIIISADKTHNFYRMAPKDYKKLLTENVTKDYRQVDEDVEAEINAEAAIIAKDLDIDDRVDIFSHKDPYLTVKDHKGTFPARIEARLINPSKSQMGKVAKTILDRIISTIKSKTGLTQWKSTGEVITWFNSIENKRNKYFIKYDVISYYPSITEALFNQSIDFAKTLTPISDDELKILHNSRKQLVSWANKCWTKKQGLFDVSMGSYDGAECCNLVGLFLLHNIKAVSYTHLTLPTKA